MRVHLTELAVRALRPRPGKQFKAWDSSTAGFGVLVGDSTKSWIVMYGVRRALKVIGHYPDVPLSAARAEAKRILASGSLAQVEARVVCFDEALREFLAEVERRNRATTFRDYKRLITRHFGFSSTALPEITPQDILRRLDRLKSTPSEQRHALVALKVFMAWCERRFYLKSSPCARLQAPGAVTTRERVLTDSELAAVLLQDSQNALSLRRDSRTPDPHRPTARRDRRTSVGVDRRQGEDDHASLYDHEKQTGSHVPLRGFGVRRHRGNSPS